MERYISAALDGAIMQIQSHDNTWGFSEANEWHVDQDTQKIIWTFDCGKVVTADVQIIGSYNYEDGSFLWAWDNPSLELEIVLQSLEVKKFGKEHGFKSFIDGKIYISEKRAWEFAAVANRLTNTNGIYSADTGGPRVFLSFGEVSINSKQP